jgi:hypothetical protein
MMVELVTKREKILRRMLAIAQAIDEIDEASRNQLFADTGAGRRITILEGEELVPDDRFGGHKASDKSQVLMIPEWLIDAGAQRADVGSDLNALYGRCIKAVLTDAELLALTVNGRSIRYGGMTSDLAFMAQMQGKMSLKFRVLYTLDPNAL